MKKLTLALLLSFILLIGGYYFRRPITFYWQHRAVPKAQYVAEIPEATPTTTIEEILDSNEGNVKPASGIIEVSKEINLPIPFVAQAPFGDWSPTYNEACEEASLIMLDAYLRRSDLTRQEMKDKIDEMVAWQSEVWGGHHDIAVSKVEELSEHFFPQYRYQIITSLTADKIKQQLRIGRPVIVPAAGRELHNPNFKQPGPLYHMLIVKGFTRDGRFITNDPGTRNGADYIYDEAILMNAVHDWTGEAADGDKIGLLIY